MGFFYFLKQKKFYLHLLFVILLTVIVFWAVVKSLDSYTRHGEVYVVPDFEGIHYTRVMDNYGEQFNFILIDSVYHPNAINGAIIAQNPSPNAKVKQGRNVYLTIIAQMPEEVPMPNLRNLSLRQAMVTLSINGLHVNELFFVDYFARNAVVEQEINGEIIEPETPVFKGTYIDLVVGNGGSSVNVPLPFIIGDSPDQAVQRLHAASLNLGNVYYMDRDSLHARVYRTEPSLKEQKTMPIGGRVDVWYRSELDFSFPGYLELMLNDSIDSDSLSIILNDPDIDLWE